MIRVSVLYPNSEGAAFDMDYYCNNHMVQVHQLLSATLRGMAVDRGLGTPEAPAPYIAVGYLLFDAVEDFQSALATHGPALLADIPNYTNTRPTFQISEVRL